MAQPAYLKYRLLNLPSTHVVQKVYVGATYVYALQLAEYVNRVQFFHLEF